MTKVRILFVAALMAISSLACAQETMKKGDKGWTDLEKQLADINDQWVCAHKYHKDHAMDCVDFKNNIWPETFFEVAARGKWRPSRKWSRGRRPPPKRIRFHREIPARIHRTSS